MNHYHQAATVRLVKPAGANSEHTQVVLAVFNISVEPAVARMRQE